MQQKKVSVTYHSVQDTIQNRYAGGRMAQLVNALAVKPGILSFTLETHMVEGEKQLLQVAV